MGGEGAYIKMRKGVTVGGILFEPLFDCEA